MYVQGVKQFEFDKTNSNSITLPKVVPAGTKVEVTSIPMEGAFNIEELVTFGKLEADYTKTKDLLTYLKTVDGSGSGLDADLLDGSQATAFVKKTELLTEIIKVDGTGSGVDADLLDGYHASKTSAANVVPVTGTNGKLAEGFMPWGRGGFEVAASFDIVAGASVLELPSLD